MRKTQSYVSPRLEEFDGIPPNEVREKLQHMLAGVLRESAAEEKPDIDKIIAALMSTEDRARVIGILGGYCDAILATAKCAMEELDPEIDVNESTVAMMVNALMGFGLQRGRLEQV